MRLGTSPRRPKLVSNETHNDVSVVHRQDVSMVSLYDVALERCNHNVLSKSQLKNPMTLRGMSAPRLWINSQIIVRIIVSCSNQTPFFPSTNTKGNKKKNLDCKIAELILHVKTAIFINNTYNIYLSYIH